MKTVIAGSRSIFGRHHLDAALQRCPFTHRITSVVCGGAPGIDLLGDQWAKDAGLPVQYFLVTDHGDYPYGQLQNVTFDPETGLVDNVTIAADWKEQGFSAGPIRNKAMANEAEALLAIPKKGDRRGTDSMIAHARKRGLLIFTHEVE